MMKRFVDRTAAGRKLATALHEYSRQPDLLVVGLPRGGVPVAFEVAQSLHAPLDVMIVRKIGAPAQPEFACGAIASGGVIVLNEDVPCVMLESPEMDIIIASEQRELERREQTYRAGRGPLRAGNRTVILVDDGAATGSTMLAAVRAARLLGARKVVVALPVASREAVEKLSLEADEVACLHTPSSFSAVGYWYEDFPQTTDAEVRALLARADAAYERDPRPPEPKS